MCVYISVLGLDSLYASTGKTRYTSAAKIYRLSASSNNLIEKDNSAKRRLLFGYQFPSLYSFPSATSFASTVKPTSMELNIGSLRVGETSSITAKVYFTDSDATFPYKNDVSSKTFLTGAAFTLISSWKFYTSTSTDCIFFAMKIKKNGGVTLRHIALCPINTDNTSTLEV